MRLEVNNRLAGADKFRHLPAEVRGQFHDLFRLGRTLALFDGDVGRTAVIQISGHVLLRDAPGLAGFRKTLTENPRIDRFKLKHGFPLPLTDSFSAIALSSWPDGSPQPPDDRAVTTIIGHILTKSI